MADTIRMFFLLLFASTALTFALRALRHWQGERAGRVYELPVDRRGVALRIGAAGAAALVAAVLAVPLLHRSPAPVSSASSLAGPAAPSPARTAPRTAPAPPPPPRTPEPAPPAPSPPPSLSPEARTLGHPSGGTLQLLSDGTRVWLPPFYDTPHAAGVAYPVVLAHVDDPKGDPDLYAGLAEGLRRGRSDPFVLVMPDSCDRDSGALLTEVAHRYRTLTSVSARAVLGIGAQAPCAVREALANPGRYQAGIGISGTYPELTETAGPQPPLLLASLGSESGSYASAVRLRESLNARGDAVRLIDGVGRRSALMSLVAAYLTEKLDGASALPGAAAVGSAEGPPVRARVPAQLAPRAPAYVPTHRRTQPLTQPLTQPRTLLRPHAPAHVPAPAPARTPARTHHRTPAPVPGPVRKPVRSHAPAHAPTRAPAHRPAAHARTPAPARPPAHPSTHPPLHAHTHARALVRPSRTSHKPSPRSSPPPAPKGHA
ncbi:hypothetical protein GA0115240_144832 [Streptomyces sp. DvalAA-14]|uniref:hypothetical protein n=1 Tax=unclassified Streptomyces TaxID=2593676 RepID=UPI00081BB611|nr:MULTISPECIES: hypothetical protein [unclassified Streptomyces]MYS22780.1 hypothetical protein [Streptomyces sp. SID4948]SCE22374.1 hypothetical protein GA0115240_144832 [Streptomyces sp. DvalAA-14]